MMCTYASRQDFDDWAALGIEGWSFDDLAPYYRKFEAFDLQQKSAPFYRSVNPLSDELHSANGPIQVSFPKEERVADRAWLDTFDAVGLKATEDAKGGGGNGAYTYLCPCIPLQRIDADKLSKHPPVRRLRNGFPQLLRISILPAGLASPKSLCSPRPRFRR